MIRLNQLKLPVNHTEEQLVHKTAQSLRIPTEDILELEVVRQSLDARKKPELFYSYSIDVIVKKEEKVYKDACRRLGKANVLQTEKRKYHFPAGGTQPQKHPTVIVGCGPAGLFCGYYLALHGYRPVILERGADVDTRQADVERFWETGKLQPDSNVQFGEGGAGTFSDGKLNTLVKDKYGRNTEVLRTFVRYGADPAILYQAKPHIGTDVLSRIVKSMREEILRLGGEVHFHSQVTEILTEGGHVTGVKINAAEELPCEQLVLAPGHSARDTFELLKKEHITMSQKPFAMGIRVQHRQEDIDCAQYGFNDEKLPASPYKLTGKTTDGRGVYSFCMCPGGYVVNASSEEGGLVVNGMSNADRASGFANSAIVVSVSEEDFEGDDCLAGVALQRKYEKLAYELADGKIPVQRYEDFCNNQPTKALGKVAPCVEGKWQFSNIRLALPNFIINGIIDGMGQFAEKIHEFDHPDTLLLGLESRTSSPVRIERNEDFESVSLAGLYPCGEGAGYAGGIMSAAMDGLRIAMKIQEKKKEESNHA